MDRLEIELVPGAHEVIVRGAMPVTVVVKNATDGLVLVHSPEASRPFTYHLEHKVEGTCHELSQDNFLSMTRVKPMPPMEEELEALAPGEAARFEEDVAAYAVETLPPGPYEMVAEYNLEDATYRSKPVKIEIVVPRSDHCVRLVTEDRVRLAAALTHTSDQGAATPYQYEDDPPLGVWHPRPVVKAPATIGGMALCAFVTTVEDWRWMGWLEGDGFRGVVGWGSAIALESELVPLGLKSPRLVETGWQYDDGRARFLVMGAGDAGAELRLIRFESEGDCRVEPMTWGAEPPPDRITATFAVGSDTPIQIVWTESRGRLRTRTATPGGSLGPARTLLDNTRPVLALGVSAVSNDGPGTVHLLLGPAQEKPALLYVTVPIAEGARPTERELELPEGEAVTAWALDPSSASNHPVLAQTANRLLLARVGAPDEWTAIEEEAGSFRHIGLVRLQTLIATWLDPEKGLRYRTIE